MTSRLWQVGQSIFQARLLRFANGATLYLETSWLLNQAEDEIRRTEVYGTAGGATTNPFRIMVDDGTGGGKAARALRQNTRESLRAIAGALNARARGKREALSDERLALPVPMHWLSPLDLLLVAFRRRRRMLGETSIYVLTKPDAA